MSDKNTISRLLRFIKPYKRYAVGIILSAIISVALTLLMPVLVGHAVDAIIGPNDVLFSKILKIAGQLAVVIIVGALFSWILARLTNIITYSTTKDLRKALFDKLHCVPLSFVDGRSHGDIVSRVTNDVDTVGDGLLQGFTQLFTGVATILGTLGFMFYINWIIALVVVCLTPLSLFTASIISKKSYEMFHKQMEIQGRVSAYANEMISGQRTIKAYGYEDTAYQEFAKQNEQLNVVGRKAQFYSSLTNPTTRFINGIVTASVAVSGALCAINGLMTVGMISSFLLYANQYTKPFNEISGVITQLQAAKASAQRLFAILDEENESPDGSETLKNCQGNVELNGVSFSYRPDVSLIENLSFNAKPGQKIAIVGPTGSGKTTIVNLLMRFYDVNQGQVLIDGKNIQTLKRDSLRQAFGMVLQETWLFAGTVKDNISYGKPDATDSEIKQAAKAAYAHGFISRLPEGYDTVITDRGGNLSQGQRQLLCIARVILCDPQMLILDEATSNIDTRTEQKVQSAFDAMMERGTSFVVAHRLSTIQKADIILVLKQGNIVEQGTHEQLLAMRGFYFELYNSQFAGVK